MNFNYKQLLGGYIIPCFSEPDISPRFARRATKAAGNGIMISNIILTLSF